MLCVRGKRAGSGSCMVVLERQDIGHVDLFQRKWLDGLGHK